MTEEQEHEQLQMLAHQASPAYRKAFIIITVLAGLYLAIIFLATPPDEVEVRPDEHYDEQAE